MVDKLYSIFKESTGISIDTRSLDKDNLFFALKGPNFDGNKYAEQAIEDGALCAVVDDPAVVDSKKADKYFLVTDVLESLQELAGFYRDKLSIPVLAITGTNGKTTTKELVAAVLQEKYELNFTKGNLNNHIGVPLTILATSTTVEFLIVEMGANHIGDIDFLCRIAKPTHGVITNVGKAHLEGFGSFDNIIKTKTELYQHLAISGLIIYNNEDEILSGHLPPQSKQYGYKPSKLERLEHHENDLLYVTDGDEVIKSQLVGKYNLYNIACALAIGALFEVPKKLGYKGIADYQPKLKRSQYIEKSGHKFVLDAYNANPTSMKNSIGSFIEVSATNKILILGEMLEMGDYSQVEHASLLEWINNYDWKGVWLVGNEFRKIDLPDGFKWFENTDDLISWFRQSSTFEPSYFLIKGSRGVKLEQFLELFDE